MPRAQYCLNGYFVDIGSTSLIKKLLQNVTFPGRKCKYSGGGGGANVSAWLL